MIQFRQKEFMSPAAGTALAGAANVGSGLGTAGLGAAKIAGGLGQLGSAGLSAGGALLKSAGGFLAAHPLLAGGLAAYGIYKLLKRRRERKMAERGYSVVEKMYSEKVLKSFAEVEYRKAVRRTGKRALKNGIEHYSSESIIEEKKFAAIPAAQRNALDRIATKIAPDLIWSDEVLDRARKIRSAYFKKGVKSAAGKVRSSASKVKEGLRSIFTNKRPQLARAFSEVSSDEQSVYMPIPKAPREEVPKKIVKKAEKSGVVQRDSNGNWRIINMHGPGGKAIYWKPVYKSKESAENCLRAYQAGKWSKKK